MYSNYSLVLMFCINLSNIICCIYSNHHNFHGHLLLGTIFGDDHLQNTKIYPPILITDSKQWCNWGVQKNIRNTSFITVSVEHNGFYRGFTIVKRVLPFHIPKISHDFLRFLKPRPFNRPLSAGSAPMAFRKMGAVANFATCASTCGYFPAQASMCTCCFVPCGRFANAGWYGKGKSTNVLCKYNSFMFMWYSIECIYDIYIGWSYGWLYINILW